MAKSSRSAKTTDVLTDDSKTPFNYRNLNVYVVGDVGNPDASIVRVVHISDTHDKHGDFLQEIPRGHILVHSGDFADYNFSRHFFKERDFHRQLSTMNAFFGRLTHPYKIFVAGSHDMNLERHSPGEIQSLLPNAIYLQDAACSLFGLKFYGTPWNPCKSGTWARGFSRDWHFIQDRWREIPYDTDIVVSHIPPWNNEIYTEVSERIKPTLHLFGYDHDTYGIKWKDQILFSNASLSYGTVRPPPPPAGCLAGTSGNSIGRRTPIVIDVYVVASNIQSSLPDYGATPAPVAERANKQKRRRNSYPKNTSVAFSSKCSLR